MPAQDRSRSGSQRVGRREWIALGVLALPALLISLDNTVLYLAIPHLSAGLNPSGLQLLWIVDVYSFMIASLLIVAGTLGDRVGRRRLLLMGAAGFGVASLLTAFSVSAEMLIISRALLGIAGATLMPSSMSLIQNMFTDARQRALAFSVWIACFLLGGAIGPLVGGVMLEKFWWGSVFLLSVPAMIVLLTLGRALLPEYRDPEPGRLDIASVALLVVALLAAVYGVKKLAGADAGPLPATALTLGVVLGIVFVHRQRRITSPLIDLKLFRERTFSTSLGTMGLALFVMAGSQFFVTQYMQMVIGLSPFATGLCSLPASVGGVMGALLAPLLLRRMRAAAVMTSGLVITAVGFAILTQINEENGIVVAMVALGLLNFGVAPTIALGTDMMISSAPPEKAGAVSAISETTHEVGLGAGIAVLGSIGTTVYRGQTSEELPKGLPDDSVSAFLDTIGSAVEEAGRLPDRVGAAALDVANAAFTRGMLVVSVICLTVTVLALSMLSVLLRRTPVNDTEVPDADGATDAQSLQK